MRVRLNIEHAKYPASILSYPSRNHISTPYLTQKKTLGNRLPSVFLYI